MAGPRLDVDKLTLLASFGRKRRPVAAIRTGVVGQDDDALYPRPDYILSSSGIVCAILQVQAAFKQCGFRTFDAAHHNERRDMEAGLYHVCFPERSQKCLGYNDSSSIPRSIVLPCHLADSIQ